MLHTLSDAIAGLSIACPRLDRNYGFSSLTSATGSSPVLRWRLM